MGGSTRMAACLFAVLALTAADLPAAPEHSPWPGYRGPNTSGIYPAHGLLREWPKGGPKLLWRQRIGLSAAPVTVWDGKVYAVGGTDAWLHVLSLDGKRLGKAHVGNASWKRFSFTRSTPLVGEGVATATTPNSDMYGIDLARMEQRWKVNTYKSFGSGNGSMGWGIPESPMFNPPLVIFSTVSRDDITSPMMAVDIRDGSKVVWGMDPGIGKNYSAGDNSSALFRHNGRNLIVTPSYCYLTCLDADTGKVFWELPCMGHKNLTPVYHDNGMLLLSLHRERGPAEKRWWPAWPGLPVEPAYRRDRKLSAGDSSLAAAEDACDPQAPPAGKGGAAEDPAQMSLRTRMSKTKWGRDEMAMLELSEDGLEARVKWVRHGVPPRYGHAVVLDGRIYCYGNTNGPVWHSEDGILPPLTGGRSRSRGCRFLCLDADTGALIDQLPSATPGHVVAADGMIYAVDLARIPHPLRPAARMKQGPRVRLIRPTAEGMEVAGVVLPMGYDDIPELRDVEWAASVPPVIAEGRLFVSYGDVLAYDVRGEDYQALPAPPPVRAPPVWEHVRFPSTNGVGTVRAEDVPFLVEQLGSRYEAHRKAAVALLCRADTPRNAALVKQLGSAVISGGDPAWQRQAAAAEVLACMGPAAGAVLPELRKALPEALKARDGSLSRLILTTLRRIDARAVESVVVPVAGLLEDGDPYVAYMAAGILKRIGPAAGVEAEALAAAMRSDDARVWTEAGTALVVIGRNAAPAIPLLREQLVAAIESGGSARAGRIMAACNAIDPNGIRPVVPRIAAFLQGDDAERRKIAATVLKRAGAAGAAAVPAMVEALKSDDDSALAALSDALAAMETEAGLVAGELAKVVSEGEGAMRLTSVKILERMGQGAAPAVDSLTGALCDADLSLARAAAKALVAIGQEADGAVDALVVALKHEDRELARAAATALGTLGLRVAPAATPALLAALGHGDTTVRWNAAKSLDALGHPPAPTLLKMLQEGGGHLRYWAAEALARYPGDLGETLAALTEALASPDRRLADSAMRAVGRLGPKAGPAVPRLLAMARTNDMRRASYAMRTIRQVGAGAESAIPELMEMTQSTNRTIVCEAVNTLSGIGRAANHTVPALLALSRKWRNRYVDSAINRALPNMKTNNVPPKVSDVTATCVEGESVEIKLPISDEDDVVPYIRVWMRRPRHGYVKGPGKSDWHRSKATYYNTRGFVGEDVFEWNVSDPMRGGATAKATITITPDTTGPTMTEAVLPLGVDNVVMVTFSEPVVAETVAKAESFSIEPDVPVVRARSEQNGRAATLTTAPLAAHVEYKLSAKGICDMAKARNRRDSEITFVYRPLVAGLTRTAYKGLPVYPRRSRALRHVDTSGMTPSETDVVEDIGWSVSNRTEKITVRFDGVIRVPRRRDGGRSGHYTFSIASAGESRLYLNGTILTDNRRGERGGGITLASGPHRITVFYSPSVGREPRLDVFWSGPGIGRQKIPAAVLCHQGRE